MREDIKKRIEIIQKGEVPEGYKKTRVGIIPTDWSVLSVDSCIKESKKLSNEIEKYMVYSSTRNGLLPQNEYFDKEESTTTNLGYKVVENDYITYRHMSDDDIFHFNLNSTGKTILVSCEYPVFTTNKCANKKILLAILNNSKRFRYFCRMQKLGGTRTRLYLNKLGEFRLGISSIKEQNEIEEILSKYDRIINNLEQTVLLKYKQKQWIAQVLFGRKIRLKGNSKDWEKTCLYNILSERKEYSTKGLEYEHVTLSKDGIYPKGDKYDRDHLVKDEEKKYKITHLNDICYNPANLKFGVICRNTYGDAIFSPIYVTFEVNSQYDVEFVSQYLVRWDFINAVRKYEEGTVYERMAVSPGDFLGFEVVMPDLEEQKAISNVLFTADREINLLEKKIEQIKLEKKAMMQLLLTGIVRVNQKGGE